MLRLVYAGMRLQPLSLGLYCTTTGDLVFKATFLTRTVGATVAACGLVWLITLAPNWESRAELLVVSGADIGPLWLSFVMIAIGVDEGRWNLVVEADGEWDDWPNAPPSTRRLPGDGATFTTENIRGRPRLAH